MVGMGDHQQVWVDLSGHGWPCEITNLQLFTARGHSSAMPLSESMMPHAERSLQASRGVI